jgi:hypothetical protein
MARSRRTPRVLILPMLLGAFQPPKPENRRFCGELERCKKQRLLRFLLSAKQVSAYGTASWAAFSPSPFDKLRAGSWGLTQTFSAACKPSTFSRFTARLKSCPDTERVFRKVFSQR